MGRYRPRKSVIGVRFPVSPREYGVYSVMAACQVVSLAVAVSSPLRLPSTHHSLNGKASARYAEAQGSTPW